MNNSFHRLIDGMCATLRSEVLTRLDDEFARGQVFGVINLLNTFKVRADWSSGFLLQQIAAQHTALAGVETLLSELPTSTPRPVLPVTTVPVAPPISELLGLRDDGNRTISALLGWLDDQRAGLPPEAVERIDALLRTAMRAEVDIELRSAPRPLFAEMSSGTES